MQSQLGQAKAGQSYPCPGRVKKERQKGTHTEDFLSFISRSNIQASTAQQILDPNPSMPKKPLT